MAASGSANGKRPTKFQSGKLGQTLTDLEAALNDWDSLSDSPALPTETTAKAASPAPSAALSSKDAELRKKAKKLLDQLREQLAELAD